MDNIKKEYKEKIKKILGIRASKELIEDMLDLFVVYNNKTLDIIRNNHGYMANHFLNCDECFAKLGAGESHETILTHKLFHEKVASELVKKLAVKIDPKHLKKSEFLDGYATCQDNVNKALAIYFTDQIQEIRRGTWWGRLKIRLGI